MSTTKPSMSNSTVQLSESELHEMRDAQRQIGQAEERISKILSKHLGLKGSEELHLRAPAFPPGTILPKEKMIQVIYEGCCKPVGVYVDPPGVCVPVS
jgi:hypothetical protein